VTRRTTAAPAQHRLPATVPDLHVVAKAIRRKGTASAVPFFSCRRSIASGQMRNTVGPMRVNCPSRFFAAVGLAVFLAACSPGGSVDTTVTSTATAAPDTTLPTTATTAVPTVDIPAPAGDCAVDMRAATAVLTSTYLEDLGEEERSDLGTLVGSLKLSCDRDVLNSWVQEVYTPWVQGEVVRPFDIPTDTPTATTGAVDTVDTTGTTAPDAGSEAEVSDTVSDEETDVSSGADAED